MKLNLLALVALICLCVGMNAAPINLSRRQPLTEWGAAYKATLAAKSAAIVPAGATGATALSALGTAGAATAAVVAPFLAIADIGKTLHDNSYGNILEF